MGKNQRSRPGLDQARLTAPSAIKINPYNRSMDLTLLVIRSAIPEQLAQFYTQLGLTFEYHKHGNGPYHYSTHLGHTVLEIYPLAKGQENRIVQKVSSIRGLATPELYITDNQYFNLLASISFSYYFKGNYP